MSEFDTGMCEVLVNFAAESQFRRSVMQVMAWSLSHEERVSVRQAFLTLDTANNGTISLLEMRQVLEQQFKVPNEQINKIFRALDSNNDGLVHYTEFLAAMLSARLKMHDQLLAATFKRFDKDGSGTINVKDFKIVFGETASEANVEAIMHEIDTNADGRVSYEEFIAFLHNGEERMAGAADACTQVIDKEIKMRGTQSVGTLDLPLRDEEDNADETSSCVSTSTEHIRKRDRMKALAFKLMGGF